MSAIHDLIAQISDPRLRERLAAEGKSQGAQNAVQPGLFDAPFENLPLCDAIDLYRHERGWANRLTTTSRCTFQRNLSASVN